MGNVKPTVYNLPAVKAADDVCICEGARKAQRLIDHGFNATACPNGAAGWRDEFGQIFTGKNVFIFPDSDDAGQKFLHAVGSNVSPHALQVQVIRMPDGFNDVVDLIRQRQAEGVDRDGIESEIMQLQINAESFTTTPIEQAIEQAEPFPLIRFDDLLKFKPDPSATIAGEGWLRRGAGTLLTGSTGLGKSVLVVQLAAAVAHGLPWFGITTRPCKVLILEAENDLETCQRDVLSVQRHLKACPVAIHAGLYLRHVYGLQGEAFAEFVRADVERLRPDLLVLDNYGSFVGAADLNGSSTFPSFINPIQGALTQFGVALLLVAHTPKPRDRDNWTARDSVYMAAGHSAIANWCRASCELTAIQNDDQRFRLRFGKNAERTGLTDDHGQLIRDLYLEHSGNRREPFWRLSDEQGEPSASPYAEQIISLAVDHPSMSQRAIADKVGCGVGTVNKYYPRKAG